MTTIYNSLGQDAYNYLYRPAVIIGGGFVLVALVLSTFLIFQYLRSYTNPAEQKWIVAVIFMVPVYATESIISLCDARLSLACDILRNCYEAFALYAFGSYLVACLGGERRTIQLLEKESRKLLKNPLLEDEPENRAEQRGSLCNFVAQPSIIGEDLLTIEKFGLVQYMILKTVCAFLALMLQLFGVYGDGEFKWYYGYPYITVVINFSQMWALYCLVQFYNVTHEKLRPIKPLAKFISFKAIVFATWWQGVGIALLCAFGVLPKEDGLKNGLQDFLICIEMAIAAVAHIFVFSVEPYRFISNSSCGKISTETTKTELKLGKGKREKPIMLERTETETRVESPGTSIKESFQDIVVEGGQHVVEDVVLTINQAIGPVEKGVAKIQETLHLRSESKEEESNDGIKEQTDVQTHLRSESKEEESNDGIMEQTDVQTHLRSESKEEESNDGIKERTDVQTHLRSESKQEESNDGIKEQTNVQTHVDARIQQNSEQHSKQPRNARDVHS